MNANKLSRLFPNAGAAFLRLNSDTPLAPEAEAPKGCRPSCAPPATVPVAPVSRTVTKHFTVPGLPVAAPRMTRKDKWQQRPCVLRYREYKDRIRAAAGGVPLVPDEVRAVFYFPVKDSWPKWKRLKMDGKGHRQDPDHDNLEKAVCDALFEEDNAIWKASQEKRWCRPGMERTEITLVYEAPEED